MYKERANGGDFQYFPDKDKCNINVLDQSATVEGDFYPDVEYHIELLIHENGYIGSNSGSNYYVTSASKRRKFSVVHTIIRYFKI